MVIERINPLLEYGQHNIFENQSEPYVDINYNLGIKKDFNNKNNKNKSGR